MSAQQDQQRGLGRGAQATHIAQGLPTVHAGHLPIDKQGIGQRLVRIQQLLDTRQRLLARGRCRDLPAQRLHQGRAGGQGLRVVVHQHGAHRRRPLPWQDWQRRKLGDAEFDGEAKAAALVHHAAELQLAAHQTDQTRRNHQPQAGAAKAARGVGLGLGKGGKNAFLVFWRNANARVHHRHCQHDPLRGARHQRPANHDLPGLGELDGIAAQIDQDLLEPHGVANQLGRNGRVHVKHQIHILGAQVR